MGVDEMSSAFRLEQTVDVATTNSRGRETPIKIACRSPLTMYHRFTSETAKKKTKLCITRSTKIRPDAMKQVSKREGRC